MLYTVNMDVACNTGSIIEIEIEARNSAEAIKQAISDYPQYDNYYAKLDSAQLFLADVHPTDEQLKPHAQSVRNGYIVNGSFYVASDWELIAL